MNDRLGCYWYVGMTQTKKTTLAYEAWRLDIQTTRRPGLIIDPMPAWNFRGLPHCQTVGEVLDTLYGRKSCAVWTPRRRFLADGRKLSAVAQVSKLMDGIRADDCGRIHVLWDEGSFHMSSEHIEDGISEAVRGWAHHELTFRLVTQRPGDIHGDCYACDPEVYAFRIEKWSDLERCRKEWGFNPDDLRVQGVGEFKVKRRGFTNDASEKIHPGSEGRPAAPPQGIAGSAD